MPTETMMQVSMYTALITFGLTIWTYATLYKDKDSVAVLLRIVLFLFLLLVTFLILIIIFGIGFGMYLHKTGKI